MGTLLSPAPQECKHPGHSPLPNPHGHSSPWSHSSALPTSPKANQSSTDLWFLQGSTHPEEPLLSPWVRPALVPSSHIHNLFADTVWHLTHLPCWRRTLTGLLKGLISTFNTRRELRQPQMLEMKLSAVEVSGQPPTGCLLHTDTHATLRGSNSQSYCPSPLPGVSQGLPPSGSLSAPSFLSTNTQQCFYLRQNTLHSSGLS